MSRIPALSTVVEAGGLAAHLRLWRPPARPPVVILGELADVALPVPERAVQVLVSRVRSLVGSLPADTDWFFYRPWYGEGPDQLTRIDVDGSGVAVLAGPAAWATAERRVAAPIDRYLAADYTRAGVRVTRQAVAALAAAHRQATGPDAAMVAVGGGDVLGAFDDLVRLLSRARDVAGDLAGQAAVLPTRQTRLSMALAGPVQRALTAALATTVQGMAGSAGAATAAPADEEPTLVAEFVFDADQRHGEPVLGVAHLRMYRPGAGGVPLVVVGQIDDPSAAPALTAAAALVDRARGILGLDSDQSVQIVVAYPEGMLAAAGEFYQAGSDGPQPLSRQQVEAWAGGRVRPLSADSATIARLP